MVSYFQNEIIFLFILGSVKVSLECQEWPRRTLTEEYTDNDIVMTLEPKSPDDFSQYSVKSFTTNDPTIPVKDQRFMVNHVGPLWHLILVTGTYGMQSDVKTDFEVEIECVDMELQRSSSRVTVSVYRDDLVDKKNLYLPDYFFANVLIHFDTHRVGSRRAEYHQEFLPGMNNGTGIFEIQIRTGKVYLRKNLDCEHDPKVVWIVLKKTWSGGQKTQCLRIEIQCRSGPAPQFFLNKTCLSIPQCYATGYNFTMDHVGNLTGENGNSIYAKGRRRRRLSYSVIKGSEQLSISINRETGKLSARRPTSHLVPIYIVIVQVTDGRHKTNARVIINVEGVTCPVQGTCGVIGQGKGGAGADSPRVTSTLIIWITTCLHLLLLKQ